MNRPGILALLVAVLIAWAAIEGFWAYQDSRPNPCGQYFAEDAVQ